jgi:SPP1 gp7 family putative phage head morphogenesis protein
MSKVNRKQLLERRLNRKLLAIVTQISQKLRKNPPYNPREYDVVIQEAYKEYIRAVLRLGEQEIIRHPHVELTESVIGVNKLERIIQERSFRASQATLNHLHGEVMPRIQKGIKEGQSLGKTSKLLEKEFRDMSRGGLMRISRTETQGVYNNSKMETMQSSQVVEYKKWVASGLDNMRESHAELDGETIPLDEPFSNGLMYPGDETGPPEEVINCACTLVPVIKSPSRELEEE